MQKLEDKLISLEKKLPQEAFTYMSVSWGNSAKEFQLIASLGFVDGATYILKQLKNNE